MSPSSWSAVGPPTSVKVPFRVPIRQAEPERFERAALRWLARLCVERREATLAQVQAAAWAFDNIADEPAAVETLERLCSR